MGALNLARNSLSRPKIHAEIYLLLAARLKISWPKLPRYFQRKALRKAATIASQSDVGSELSWLLGTEGSTFFLTELWTLSDRKAGAGCGLTSAPVSLSPVTQIIRFYRDSMLQSALDTVICPTSSSQISKVLPVLSAVSRSNEMVGSLTGDRHDSVADWWTSLLKCTANWSLNKMDEAEQSYPDIDCLPLPYQECEDPSYVALLAAQTTHRVVLSEDRETAPTMCDHASEFVDEAVLCTAWGHGRCCNEEPSYPGPGLAAWLQNNSLGKLQINNCITKMLQLSIARIPAGPPLSSATCRTRTLAPKQAVPPRSNHSPDGRSFSWEDPAAA